MSRTLYMNNFIVWNFIVHHFIYNDLHCTVPVKDWGLPHVLKPDWTPAHITNLRRRLNIVNPMSLQSGPFWEEHKRLWICEHFSHMVPFFPANCGSLAAPLINYITAQQTSILGSVRGHVHHSWKHFFMMEAVCPVSALHQRQAWHQSRKRSLATNVRSSLCARQIHTIHHVSVKGRHKKMYSGLKMAVL